MPLGLWWRFGENGLTEGDIVHVCQYNSVPEMLSGPAAFQGLSLVKALRVSTGLMFRAGAATGGDGLALLSGVRFDASKHSKVNLSGQEASLSSTFRLDL